MKVTKRKTGYTIRCNNGEFEMLDKLVGITPPDAAKLSLSGGAKAAYTRRVKATNGDLLQVDSDLSNVVSHTVPPTNGFAPKA